ncbi:hypothetical protein MUP35_02590 [Patescibacteria group bacterium]|nr:hypothetical protein [Patescibacteria group bacterium]
MVKTTKPSPQLLRQIRQLSEEKLPESKNEKLSPQETDQNEPFKESLEQQQMKANDEVWAKKRIQEIEEEIKILTQKRQEEMRKRDQQKTEEQKQKEQGGEKIAKAQRPLEISSKPKKGLPFWGKRIKTAQQQAQPETAGRRVGG